MYFFFWPAYFPIDQPDDIFLPEPPPIVPKPYPWLVVSHGVGASKGVGQSFVDIASNEFYSTQMPELDNKVICANRDGLLLLWDKNSWYYSLLNLVTKELVQLPRDIHHYTEIYVLSSDNDVVIVAQSPPSFRRWRPGDKRFRTHSFSDTHVDEIVAATMFKGKLHFLTISNTESFYALYTAEFVGPLLRFEKYAIEDLEDYAMYIDSYLFVTEGELLLVQKETGGFKSRTIRDVNIYRLDLSSLKWERVGNENLGGRTFFISSLHLSCVVAGDELGEGIQRNAIYFFKEASRYVHVFHYEEAAISKSQLPCPYKHKTSPYIEDFGPPCQWILIPPN